MARLQALEADGWKTYTSRSTGRKYYYNERTDESTYTLPEPSVPATPPRARAAEEAAPPEEATRLARELREATSGRIEGLWQESADDDFPFPQFISGQS